MSVEERPVALVTSNGVEQARFVISTRPPWFVRLVWTAEELEAEGRDLFECLTAIRRELDPRGVKVCCVGAREDVYPSGMARQMGGGRRAYVHHLGRHPTQDDLVDIFDPADPEAVVTVVEQEAAVRSRYE